MNLRWFKQNKNQTPAPIGSQLNFDILPNLLTIEQVSEILGVHPNTLRNWDRSGRLRAVRIGSRQDRRYPREDIQQLYHEIQLRKRSVAQAPKLPAPESKDDNRYVLKPRLSWSWFKLYFLSQKFSFFVFSVLIVSFTFAVIQVSFFAYIYLVQAEESSTAVSVIAPTVADGWEYSTQALAIDLLPNASLDEFSATVAAHYHQLPDMEQGTPISIEHTVQLEDESAHIEERTSAPLNDVASTILVSDFVVPKAIDPDSTILSSTLEVSFATAGAPDSEDVLVLEYSVNNGKSWNTMESFPLSESISNEIHEGYWGYDVAELTELDLVSELKFRATYVPGGAVTDSIAWLDGVALILETQKPDPVLKDINESVSFGTGATGDKDLNADESPTIAVQTKEKSTFGFLGVQPTERTVTQVTVTDPTGQTEVARVTATLRESGSTTTTELTVSPDTLTKPGKYSVAVTVEQDGRTEEVVYDFTWGEIAINPLQNPYRPGDRAQFSIGLVDDTGDVVCGADIVIAVTDPTGTTTFLSTAAGTVTQSDNCYLKEEYQGPDYLGEYMVGSAGNYEVALTASYRGETRRHTTHFLAVNEPRYTIQRDGPTRVYPNVYQPMALTITAAEAFVGTIREIVPGDFEDVIAQDGGRVEPYDTGSSIAWGVEWDVSLAAGESISLNYTFKSIERAPALYFLGPLSVGSWQESRQWQLVIDATYLYLLANTGSGVASGWVLDTGSDGNFLRAASTAGGTGGNATHTHTFTESVGGVSATANTGCVSRCSLFASPEAHTHTSTGTTIDPADNNPAHHTFYLWKYNTADATPATIPDNTFIFFDNGSGQPTSPWSRFSAADDRLIKIDASHTTGGSDTHTHDITWGSLNASSGSGALSLGATPAYAHSTHAHDAPSSPATTDSASSLPSYSTFEIYEQTSATPQTLPTGMIALFDGTPPSGWTVISGGAPAQDRLVRGSATAGSTGGDATSSHGNAVGTTDLPSSTVTSNVSGAVALADDEHTHDITLSSFSDGDIIPPYENFILAEYDGGGGGGIEIGGRVYQSDTSTSAGSGITVQVYVNGSSAGSDTTDGSGDYSVTGVTASSGDVVTVFLDDHGTYEGTTIFKVDGTDTTDVDVYAAAVIVRNDTGASITNANLESGDRDAGDDDIKFDVSSGNLTVDSNFALHIWAGDTYDPGGTVTTQGTGNLRVEGTAYLDTATNTIANDIIIVSGGTLHIQQSTTINGSFNGGVTVSGTLNITGGTVNIGDSTNEDLNITGGTVTISGGTVNIKDDLDLDSGSITIASTVNVNGNATGSVIDIDGGTFTIDTGGALTYSGEFQVGEAEGETTIVNFDGGTSTGSTNNSSHMRLNAGIINLNGGTHSTGNNAIVEITGTTGTNPGAVTFNMTGGALNTRSLLVYNQNTLTTTTVTGGIIHIGMTTGTSPAYYDVQANSHSFYSIQIDQDAQFLNTSTQPMTLEGSFIISSSRTFTLNAEEIVLNGGGAWTNHGTLTADTGTVTMRGGEINGSADTEFYNLTIDPATPGTVTVDTDTGTDDPTVTNALSVASGDTFAIEPGRTVTHTGGTVTLDGTVSGAGTIVFTDTSSGPGSGGTLSAITRYDATAGNVASTTIDARTYGGPVEFYSSSGTARTATLASGTYTLSGSGAHMYVIADGTATMSVLGDTGNPTVNIGGDLDYTGAGSGSESITSGSGSWTIDGDVDFRNGSYTASTGNTIVFDDGGASAFYPNDQTLYNLTLGGFGTTVTITSHDISVSNTLSIGAVTQLTIPAGLNVTLMSTGTLSDTSSSVMSGDGTYIHQAATFPAAPAFNVNIRLDATDNDITVNGSAGTKALGSFGDSVEFYSNTASARTITLGDTAGRTFDFNGPVSTTRAGAGSLTVQVNTYDPNVGIDEGLTIGTGTIWQASNSASFTLYGDYTNNGTFTDNSGTVTLAGTAKQTLSGTMTGSSDFNNLTITNTSGSYSGCSTSFTPGVDFATSATISGAYTITTAGVKVEYNSGSTYTMSGSINWAGSSGTEIIFRNSNLTSGTWLLNAPATQTSVEYVDVARSDASSGTTVDANTGTNIDCGNNTNWDFGYSISGTANGNNGATVKVAFNSSVQAQTTTISGGTWSITGATSPSSGTIITVWVDGVTDANESTAITKYDGSGHTAGMVLNTNVLTVGSDDNPSLTSSNFSYYTTTQDEDVMHDVVALTNGGQGVRVDPSGSYADDTFIILSGATVTFSQAGGETAYQDYLQAHNVVINSGGSLTSSGAPAYTISGSWTNAGAFVEGTSGVTFTGTTSESIDNSGASDADLYNMTLNGSGLELTVSSTLLVSNNLTVTLGTLHVNNDTTVSGVLSVSGTVDGSSNLTVWGNLTGNGTVDMSGGTTTFPATNSIGGNTDWTFHNMATTHGSGCNSKTTTATGSGSFTINGTLTTSSCFSGESYTHSINPSDKLWIITATGSPVDASFSSVSAGSSTFRYTGSGSAVTVNSGYYQNLELQPNPAESTTYNLQNASTYQIYTSMTISSSVSLNPGTSTVNSLGSNPTFDLNGETLYTFTVQGVTSSVATLANTDFSVSNLIDVDTGDTLAIPSGRSVTSLSTATITLDGTISGAGRLIYQSSAAFPTSGTITSVARFDPTDNDLIMSARTYGGDVEWYYPAAQSVDRTITLGTGASQTLILSGDLVYSNNDGDNSITIDAATYDPDVTIAGQISSGAVASDGGTINTGAGTWSVAGDADFSWIRYMADTGNTFIMSGASAVLTTGYQPTSSTWAVFYDFQTSGSGTKSITSSDQLTVNGDMLIGDDTTVSSDGLIDINGGSLTTVSGTGSGVLTSTGSVTIDGTGDFGGNADWSIATLTFEENGSNVTTTATGTGSITITNELILEGSYHMESDSYRYHYLNAGSKTWILTAGGLPLQAYSRLNFNYQTSTVRYTGISNTTVEVVNYYDLQLRPSGGTNPTYTLANTAGSDLNIYHDFTIGDTAHSLTVSNPSNNPLVIVNNLTCQASSGTTTINTGTDTWAVSGNVDLTNCGGWNAQSGHTLEMDGTSKTLTSGGESLHHLTISGGSITLEDALSVAGDVTISAGTLDAQAGENNDITLAGNWTNNSTFTPQQGAVIFAGADSSTQVISGSTTFYDFTASTAGNSAGRTLRFTAGTTQTVTGTWTVTGFSGKVITLESSTTSAWTINPTAAAVTYVDVSYSTNSGADFCATFSNDGGNNTNWSISTGATCGITISGTAYTDAGSTTLDSSGGSITLVNGATGDTWEDADGTDGSGVWTISGVTQPTNGDVLTIWINGATADATLVLKYNGTDTGLSLYQNMVILRNDYLGSITNSDLANCDNDSGTNCADTEIGFTSNGGVLTAASGRALHIWTGDSFDPGGRVVTNATGGDFYVGDNATAYLDTATSTIGRDILVGSGATLQIQANTTVGGGDITTEGTSATINYSGTPTVTLSGTGSIGGGTTPSISFYNLATSGTGTTTLESTVTTGGDVSVGTGTTLMGTANLTVNGSDLIGDGTVAMSGGTVTMGASGNLGGSTSWTMNNLTVSPTGTGTTTLQTDLTINGTLTINNGDALSISSGKTATAAGTEDIAGTGSISGSGTLRFTDTSGGPGATLTNISTVVRYDASEGSVAAGTFDARTYGGLVEFYADSGSNTITAPASGTFTFDGGVTSTCSGCTSLTVDFDDATDPTIDVNGDLTIGASTTFQAPSDGTFTVSGDWTNNGAFTDNSGTVTLNGTSQQTLSGQMTGAGDNFYNLTITNSSGSATDVIFAASADVTNNFVAATAGSQIQFLAGGTYTFNNIDLDGQAEGTRVYLRSSSTGTQWDLVSAGTQSVSNTDVRDSNACGGDTIDATDGTNFDATNNDCWDFNTITFTISDTSIGFGALSSTATRYASGDGSGSATETEAHTLVAATNAANGYTIMVTGTTLTNVGSDTIDYIGGSNTAPSIGTEQFGIRLTASGGSGTVSAPYAAAGFAYDLLNFPDIIASSTGPSTATTYSVRYMSNISSITESGSYSADVTYTMTPNF